MSSSLVFDEWKNQSLEEILWLCQEMVEDTEMPTAKKWRKNGGKILGHFQVYFPEEIAHAAGMLPLKICGSSVECRHADSRFGSYLCSILKSPYNIYRYLMREGNPILLIPVHNQVHQPLKKMIKISSFFDFYSFCNLVHRDSIITWETSSG